MMDLTSYIRNIENFPSPGILFKDITPLLADPEAFKFALERMAEFFDPKSVDVIAAIESRGFILGAPLALALKKPLVLLRKPGKLPFKTISESYDLEYGKAELHMHIDSIKPGNKVALIDDVLATGGTMKASANLIEKSGGQVLGCGFLIEINFLQGRKKLEGIYCKSVLEY